MNEEMEFSQTKIIECMAVIDIDPTLTHFKPAQQKWISSIQIFSETPKDVKPSSKILNLFFGLNLVINYCEKSRLPIYQIDFITQPGPQWIPIKMPYSFADKFVDSFLCYKTEQLQLIEPLGDIDVINTQRKSLFGHDKDVLNVPNGYKVVNNPIFQSFLIYKRMKSRLEQTFKPIILESYPEHHETNLELIPSFCFPEGIKLSRQLKGFITFSFILTQSNGDRLYINFLAFKEFLNENLRNKLDVKGLESIYYDKGFCVISKYKFSDQLTQCLQHLYRLSMSKSDQPFFKVAQNFVNELKMPREISTHGFSYSYSGCNIMFEYDAIIESVSDKSIYCIFKFMPIEQILTVFKAILYERQVIFISQSKTVLGLAIEAFTSLLFPFKWENVIIPIVPLTMKQYLTAPIPFLAGVTTAQLIDLSIQSEVVIVFLDSGKVMNDQDMAPLPQKLHKQLLKRLQEFQVYDPDEVKQYLQNPQNTYMFKMMEIEHPEFKSLAIREAFFQFFMTLMKNYKKFWRNKFFKDFKDSFSNKSNESQLISDIFKVQDFLSDLSMNKVGSFGYKFTQGAIFTAFMERRHFDAGDLIANFFDDCLEKKKNKKFQGPLLIKTEKARYIVSKHPQPEKEKRFYSYERFPSILVEPSSQELIHEEIELQIQEEEIISQTQFLEFIEEERQLNYGFYEIIKVEQLKFDSYLPFLSLLMNKNKEKFLCLCRDIERGNKKIYEIFKFIYQTQIQEINQMWQEWPKFTKKQMDLCLLNKIDYFNLKLDKNSLNQKTERIISVWEGQNLNIIIKSPIKIIIVQSYSQNQMNSGSQIKSSSLTSSRICRPLLQTVYLYIPNFRIKSFLNKIFKIQAEQVFSFIYSKVKNGSDNCWNIETVIQLRQFIEKLSQEDQVKEEKMGLTQKTLSFEYQTLSNQNKTLNNEKSQVEQK